MKTSISANARPAVPRILLTGSVPYWNRVAAAILARGGFSCDILHQGQWLHFFTMLFSGRLRHYEYFYQVCCINNWPFALLLGVFGKPFILHWIGTDVVSFSGGKASRGWRKYITGLLAFRRAKIHLCDSDYLTDELMRLGIRASTITLLPETIEADPRPLPVQPAVLSYWPNHREDFFNGPMVFELARAFPHLPFYIVKAAGSKKPVPANVHFLGEQKDMEPIYDRCGILLRIPRHDSISAMVLEMLARGRYVIYNKKLPGCHFAETFEQAKEAIEQLQSKTGPNDEGSRFVRDTFSIAGQALKLRTLLSGINLKPDREVSAGENLLNQI